LREAVAGIVAISSDRTKPLRDAKLGGATEVVGKLHGAGCSGIGASNHRLNARERGRHREQLGAGIHKASQETGAFPDWDRKPPSGGTTIAPCSRRSKQARWGGAIVYAQVKSRVSD
jgi:hypothetical protein